MGSASSIEDIAVAVAAILASSWAARLVHRGSGTNLAAACMAEPSVVAKCSTAIVGRLVKNPQPATSKVDRVVGTCFRAEVGT